MRFWQMVQPCFGLVIAFLSACLSGSLALGADGPVAAPAGAADRVVIIEAFWGNKWWQAHIIEKKDDPKAGKLYKVHYEQSLGDYDEWLAADKLRSLDGGPLPAPTPSTQDLANAERDRITGKDYFVGTWGMGGVPVVNVIKGEKLGDGKTIRETRKMQGGGDRGYIRINADGTFVWAGGPGGKTSGNWHVNTNTRLSGDLVLEKADRVIGDAYVRRGPGAVIIVQKGQGGPTSRGGLVHEDLGLFLVGNVGTEFFLGQWRLNRPRSSTLLKSDYGLVEIRADGTFTHTDGPRTTHGKWWKPDAGEALVLADPWGEGDFRFFQEGATRNISGQGVTQTHLGIYARRTDAK